MNHVCRIAALTALSAWAASARAEAPEPPDPFYHNLRYLDDDCAREKKPTADFFETYKCASLGMTELGPAYFSLGGEVRERFETYRNPNFGLSGAPARNAYVLQRLLLNGDVHFNDYFRVFLQLGDMERFGARGVTSTTDIDGVDVMQAFLEFHAPSPADKREGLTFRAGREELGFGWERLIAVREGPNVRRAFDGVRATMNYGGNSFDAFVVKPVNNTTGAFDDTTSLTQTLAGGYGTLTLAPFLKSDLYVLDYDNTAAKYRGLTGLESRRTFGARLFGALNGFDWNLEGAYQNGAYRTSNISAYLLAGVVGYTAKNVMWTPRLSLEANYASGDNAHSNTLGTFDPMYPRLPYFGANPLLAPANIADVRPVLTLDPMKDVQAVVSTDWLWRASTSDGLYGSGMTMFAGTNGAKVTGAYIGQEYAVDLRWRVDPHLSVGATASEMYVGPALQQALGKDVTYGVLYAKYKF